MKLLSLTSSSLCLVFLLGSIINLASFPTGRRRGGVAAGFPLQEEGYHNQQALSPLSSSTSSTSFKNRNRRTLWYESHGRDDGREWATTIIKGAQFIKVDFNFRTDPKDCLIQTRLPPSSNGYENGCMLMTHYYTRKQTAFNTTQDLIAFIADRDNDYLFNGSTYGKIKWQLCFKDSPPLNNSATQPVGTPGWKWMKLMLQFFEDANKVLDTVPGRKENVQFIFNGLGTPSDNLPMEQFYPWNNSWSAFSSISIANMNKPGYRQAQLFNCEWSSDCWKELHQHNFSKFALHNEYPFVAWEPSREEDLKKFYDQYLSWDFYNEKGVLIAFNPDPSLYHTYTANISGRFSHQTIKPKTTGLKINETLTVLAEDISTDSSPTGNGLTYIVTQIRDHYQNLAETVLHVRGPDSVLIQVPLENCQGLDIPVDGVTGLSAFIGKRQIDNGKRDLIMISSAKSASTGFHLDWVVRCPLSDHRGQPGQQQQGQEDLSTPTTTARARRSPRKLTQKTMASSSSSEYVAVAKLGRHGFNCTNDMYTCRFLHLRAKYDSSQGKVELEGWLPADIQSTLPLTFGSISVIDSAAKDLNGADLSAAVYAGVSVAGTEILYIAAAFVWSNKHRQVFTSYIDLQVTWQNLAGPASSLAFGPTSRTIYPAPSDDNPPMLGVGMYPSASMLAPRDCGNPTSAGFGEAILLLTYGESFCQNNQVVDDDFGPLEGTKECDVNNSTWFEFVQDPIQAYTFGKIKDYLKFAKQHVDSRPYQSIKGYANTCNRGMFHGIWDAGYSSSSVLVEKDPQLDFNVLDDGYVAVASLKGIGEADGGGSHWDMICGTPKVTNGSLVLDSFPLFGFYNHSNV